MSVRLGAVSYLNARPLVAGLERSSRFDIRFDVPSRCAQLLHDREIDLGLIPSIEFLRPPDGADYRIVPGLAIASNGPVASVALYTTRPLTEVKSIALDTSSRTSVALVRVLCHRVFRINPSLHHSPPSLPDMLAAADAGLIIGDNALLLDGGEVCLPGPGGRRLTAEKFDLGSAWTVATGLPFVWAVWAGRAGALSGEDIDDLQAARDEGIRRSDELAAEHFRDAPEHRPLGARYLRENIKYSLGPREQAGLELFYRFAQETGLVSMSGPVRFFR